MPASDAPDLPFPCWVVHCDGSAQPNPGRMGLGAVLIAPDGGRHTLSERAPHHGCNNEAELRALMAALQRLRAQGARAARIYSDNSILVEQLDATADRPPVARLAPLFDEARQLLASLVVGSVHWLPRHRNAEADALARAALGLAPKPARPRGGRRR
ncbi:ribonuclease HI family protein [Variovorax sp. ZT4R33]|uniref:ribonuclease HI family protein n=1 Tax=Variovorax sp. ZT4R33 TaxID=3443743 RepID=UPI003F45C73A